MATNYVTAKYQEIYDLGTRAGQTTILGIHTPDDGNVYNMLSGFFDQFRKYRYKGCSVTMVPAAQLPADPLQVSFEAGALTCDPRDLLNPILFHGCHGEELNEILDNVYYKGSNPTGSVRELPTNTAVAESSYYAALSDPSFRKFGIQQGAKVSLRPMVHPLAVTQPIEHSDSNYVFGYNHDGSYVTGTVDGEDTGDVVGISDLAGSTRDGFVNLNDAVKLNVSGPGIPSGSVYVSPTKTIFSNGLKPLSWLPTWHFVPFAGNNIVNGTGARVQEFNIETTRLPLLYMGLFILPPSYTQEMYFRLIITHYFEFKDFSTCLTRHTPVDPQNPDRKVYTETIPEPTPGAGASSLTVVDGSAVQTSEGVY